MQENKHTIKAKLISANKNFLKSICIIFSVFTVIWAFLHFFMGFGTWQGKSYETYKEHVNCGLRYHEELPKEAEDFRYRCGNFGIAAYSMEAFTLKGQAYEEFMDTIAGMEIGPYGDELNFTGMKVSETMEYYDEYGDYIGFPAIDRYKKLIDDDIRDYTIMYYSAYSGAGSRYLSLVTNPDTGRIVIFDSGSN